MSLNFLLIEVRFLAVVLLLVPSIAMISQPIKSLKRNKEFEQIF
jgi:predicted helicase